MSFNIISAEEKVFGIIQNGCERDERGMTMVIGPAWADTRALQREFRQQTIGYRKEEIGAFGSYKTDRFAEWLIEEKGFRQLRYDPIWLAEDGEDGDEELDSNEYICQTIDQVIEMFKIHARGISLNYVVQSDDPIKIRIGWTILKPENKYAHISIPLGCFKEEMWKQRNDMQLVSLLQAFNRDNQSRFKLMAYFVGKANGNELA